MSLKSTGTDTLVAIISRRRDMFSTARPPAL